MKVLDLFYFLLNDPQRMNLHSTFSSGLSFAVFCSNSGPICILFPLQFFKFLARHCEKSHKFNRKPKTSSKFNLEMRRLTIQATLIVHACFWRVGEELARLSQRVPPLLLRQDASAAYVGHIVLIEPSSKTHWIKHAMLNSSLMLICLIM